YYYICYYLFVFFNDPAHTEIYTLSLHDALPIYKIVHRCDPRRRGRTGDHNKARRRVFLYPQVFSPSSMFSCRNLQVSAGPDIVRSEEHTSELQSLTNLVCRLLLEKKINITLILT